MSASRRSTGSTHLQPNGSRRRLTYYSARPSLPWGAGRLHSMRPLPQGTGRVQQLRRTTLRHTPARCHRAPALRSR
jgi:hypothetical protein